MTWWLAPDLSGRRLAMIRSARRGGGLAAVTFLPVALLSVTGLGDPDLGALGVLLAALATPALILLGAGLTPSALAARSDAVLSGAAAATGMPLAAALPFVVGAMVTGLVAGGADGLLRGGGWAVREAMLAALRVAPLVALAAVAWVVLVRRFARFAVRPVPGALDAAAGPAASAGPTAGRETRADPAVPAAQDDRDDDA